MALLLVFVLLTMNLSNVYADSTFDSSRVLMLTEGFEINANGLVINTYNNIKAGSAVNNTYAFYVGTNVYFIAPSSESFSIYLTYNSNNITNTVTASTHNSNYPDYYFGSTTIGPSSDQNQNIPVFANVLTALSAFDTYYQSLPPEVQYYTNYDIENGYLSVIELGTNGGSYDLTLKSLSNRISNIITGKFTYANQTYWFDDVLPDENYTIPNSAAELMDWEISTEYPTTVIGQSYHMQTELTGITSHRYMYIYNPVGYANPDVLSVVQVSSSLINNNKVEVFGVPANMVVRWYETSGKLSAVKGQIEGTLSGPEASGSASEGAIQFEDSDGNLATQTEGGNTITQGSTSLLDYVSGISNALNTFSDSIIELLKAPVSHIQQLISAGSSFMSVLYGLFSWLPAPVVDVFMSALILLVVIGVLKMLL